MSADQVKVAVIGGGRSGEHEVSLASAASAAEALASVGRWAVVALTVQRDGSWRDSTGRVIKLAEAITLIRGCDVALPLLHGRYGEDGAMAGMLDFAGVRYVGSPARAGAIAMDKWGTKQIAAAIGLTTAPGTVLTARTAGRYRWSGPVVVKPVGSGSSLGVTLVDNAELMRPAIRNALRFDHRVLVEEQILGREVDVAVLGRPDGSRVVPPPLEIISDGIFDYEAKYGGNAQFQVPAMLDRAQHKALEAAAIEIYDELGCRGVARVDFFLTRSGVVLNEVNTVPGLTTHSQVPRMFAAAGIAYSDLLAMLLDDALSLDPRIVA